MRTCERCGREMAQTSSICPSCGTISSYGSSGMTPPTDYKPDGPSYTQGYGQQSVYQQQPQAEYNNQFYTPPTPVYQPPQPGYNSSYTVPPTAYQPVSINVSVGVTTAPPQTNTAALVVEILLNVFTGIYGVGWLMAGETTTGVILLICSIVLYWPIIIVGTILTVGLGLICLGPLAIAAIIFNALMLNSALKRRQLVVRRF